MVYGDGPAIGIVFGTNDPNGHSTKLEGVEQLLGGRTNSEFCFGYLTIIDTACPSLSDCGGKVPDSASVISSEEAWAFLWFLQRIFNSLSTSFEL
jgi:hypothetical protein